MDTHGKGVDNPIMSLKKSNWAGWILLALLAVGSPVAAAPGDGLVLGSWLFHPYLDLNVASDSNVYKTPEDEVQDTYLEPEIGLKFSSSWQTNRLFIRGNVFYADREYMEEEDRAFDSYGDTISLRY